MNFQYANVAFGVVFAAIFVVAQVIVLSRILAPRVKTKDKLTTYECGEPTIGSAWIRFDMRFYTTALVFLIFEVEVAFLFPWAVVFNEFVALGEQSGGLMARLFPFIEVAVFAGVLGVGLIYVWVKGDLDWVKSLSAQDQAKSEVSLRETAPQEAREEVPA